MIETYETIVETRKEELSEAEGLEMSPVEFFFPLHAILAILFHLLPSLLPPRYICWDETGVVEFLRTPLSFWFNLKFLVMLLNLIIVFREKSECNITKSPTRF